MAERRFKKYLFLFELSRYWNSTQQTYVTQTGSENYIDQSEFKAIHGLDLSTLEFEVVNSTPDITPPKSTN